MNSEFNLILKPYRWIWVMFMIIFSLLGQFLVLAQSIPGSYICSHPKALSFDSQGTGVFFLGYKKSEIEKEVTPQEKLYYWDSVNTDSIQTILPAEFFILNLPKQCKISKIQEVDNAVATRGSDIHRRFILQPVADKYLQVLKINETVTGKVA